MMILRGGYQGYNQEESEVTVREKRICRFADLLVQNEVNALFLIGTPATCRPRMSRSS